MAFYAYHNPQATEADREHHRQKVEFDATMKEMEDWLNCLLSNLQTLRRNGPSKDILRRVEDTGNEFTTRLQWVMKTCLETLHRIEAPEGKNRT
jgi:hypothetical protein